MNECMYVASVKLFNVKDTTNGSLEKIKGLTSASLINVHGLKG